MLDTCAHNDATAQATATATAASSSAASSSATVASTASSASTPKNSNEWEEENLDRDSATIAKDEDAVEERKAEVKEDGERRELPAVKALRLVPCPCLNAGQSWNHSMVVSIAARQHPSYAGLVSSQQRFSTLSLSSTSNYSTSRSISYRVWVELIGTGDFEKCREITDAIVIGGGRQGLGRRGESSSNSSSSSSSSSNGSSSRRNSSANGQVGVTSNPEASDSASAATSATNPAATAATVTAATVTATATAALVVAMADSKEALNSWRRNPPPPLRTPPPPPPPPQRPPPPPTPTATSTTTTTTGHSTVFVALDFYATMGQLMVRLIDRESMERQHKQASKIKLGQQQ
jgi:hypothetical protein